MQKNVVVVGGDPCCLLECYVSSTSPSTKKEIQRVGLGENGFIEYYPRHHSGAWTHWNLLVGIARRTVVEISSWVQTTKKLTWDELSESSSTHNTTENKW